MNSHAGFLTLDHRAKRILLLAGLMVVASVVGWSRWCSLASAKDTCAVALSLLDQMRRDVAAIEALRRVPQSATGRTRTSQELLAQVEQSLTAAGIDRDRWHDSVPQPARRTPDSEYQTVSTRLYFQGLSLKQLAGFVHDLQSKDPTLSVTAFNLTNRHHQTADFQVDLAVSYLVFTPREHADRKHGATSPSA